MVLWLDSDFDINLLSFSTLSIERGLLKWQEECFLVFTTKETYGVQAKLGIVGLLNLTVTVVLIGAETASRKWVKYEIKRSHERGNGLLGVYIHKLKDKNGNTDRKGDNPFDNFYVEQGGMKIYLSDIYPTYDWVDDNGYENFGGWVEKAAREAGR